MRELRVESVLPECTLLCQSTRSVYRGALVSISKHHNNTDITIHPLTRLLSVLPVICLKDGGIPHYLMVNC